MGGTLDIVVVFDPCHEGDREVGGRTPSDHRGRLLWRSIERTTHTLIRSKNTRVRSPTESGCPWTDRMLGTFYCRYDEQAEHECRMFRFHFPLFYCVTVSLDGWIYIYIALYLYIDRYRYPTWCVRSTRVPVPNIEGSGKERHVKETDR